MRDYTDTTIILDKSGSMTGQREGTIAGINNFITQQKEVPGDGCWTLIQFDDQYEYTPGWQQKDQKDINLLQWDEYVPRNSTALIDAVCRTIDETGKRLSKLPDHLKPDKVLVVIMTDGLENASKRKPHELAERINHQQDKYNWKFLFLGANQDAIATAAQYHIPTSQAFTYQATNKGTVETYNMVSRATRSWKLDGINPDLNLIPEDMK